MSGIAFGMQRLVSAILGLVTLRPLRRRRRDGREEQVSAWAFLKDFRRVRPFLRPHRRLAAGSLSMVAAGSFATLIAPWPLAILIDTVLGDKPLPSLVGFLGDVDRSTLLVLAVAGGVIVTALQSGLAVVDDYVNTKLDQSMVMDLRTELFAHAQRLSLAFHDNKRTGNLMYQINQQATAVGKVTVAVPPLLQAVVTLIGMFLVVLQIQAELALIALTVVPFIYMSAGYYMKRIDPEVRRVRRLEGQSMTIVHEAMAMMRVIAAFGRERYEHARYRHQAKEALDARVRLTVRQTTFSLVVTVMTAIGTALVLGFGAHTVIQGGMTAGELLVVMGYISSIYKPLEQISHTISALQEDFIQFNGALELLDTPYDIVEKPDAKELERAAGRVTFRDVSFSYAGRRDTLQHVSFDARAGARVAIVGPTGAGKSTLLNLIPRFYDAQSGAVRVDGHDVRDLTLASLRSQISIVLQEPLLFSGTIEENIRYGRMDATTEEIVAAAEAANADEFVRALPKGYATELGERGAKLSGGERQRLSVARAFLRDAPILILDEPTSSIDSQTESVILEALDRLARGRTTFTVAHRLSTICDADLILVVNHGRIVEQGSHEALLALNGLYRQLFDAQSGARRRRAAAALSPEELSAMTAAITEARETGRELHGPALAELARAMATRNAADAPDDDADDAAWQLIGAIWSLLDDGSPAALHALAARHDDDATPAVAHSAGVAARMLADLGLERPKSAASPRDALSIGVAP